MIDKKTVYKKFENRIEDYGENAFAQKKMAQKLVSLIPDKKYSSVLEIGSYSGLLTSEIKKNIDYNRYLALDVVEKSKEYLKKIDDKIEFLKCDIENFETEQKFDLIVSNASLQWCGDFEGVINKLKKYLAEGGVLAISTFSQDNLKEIKEIFKVSLDYPEECKLRKIFGSEAGILSEEIPLKFSSSLDVLRHLKYTGVNSLSNSVLPYKKIKENLLRLNNEFDNTLTYCPIYIILKYERNKL